MTDHLRTENKKDTDATPSDVVDRLSVDLPCKYPGTAANTIAATTAVSHGGGDAQQVDTQTKPTKTNRVPIPIPKRLQP